MSAPPANAPFLKNLAANDRPTRDAAVASLRTFLTSKRTTNFSKLDFLKIWKGLFYTMWMSDRPRPQQALASDLAELLLVIQDDVTALLWWRSFWETMAREWSGIDVLRLDKFLLLLRRAVNSGMRMCRREKWDLKTVVGIVEVVEQVPVHPTEKKFPNGIRFHMADIWIDELEKVIPEDAGPGDVPIELLMRPFENMAKEGAQKLWRNKAKEMLMDERLCKWRVLQEKDEKMQDNAETEETEEEEEEEEEEWGGIQD
ncbi:hypothetical protein EDC01DRAFT_21267 [Geopyxis carbonaria]|nr:hypothetical protein EDC01DRAFT_21267 [Geopyxis carbonaria]